MSLEKPKIDNHQFCVYALIIQNFRGSMKVNFTKKAYIFIAIIFGIFIVGLISIKTLDANKVEMKTLDLSKPKNYERMGSEFRALFPAGTLKKEVDKVLVDQAGATSFRNKNYENSPYYIISYQEPRFFPPKTIKKPAKHIFLYLKNDLLVNIHPYGGDPIFADMPDYVSITSLKGDELKKLSEKLSKENK